MLFFDLSFWQSLVSNFAATIVGAGIGVYLALVVDKKRDFSSKKEQKLKVLSLLRDELNNNLEEIEEYLFIMENEESNYEKRNKQWVLGANLKNELWESFSDSGELECIQDPTLLSTISNAYFHIRSTNQLSEQYFQLSLGAFASKEGISIFTSRPLVTSLEEKVNFTKDVLELTIQTISTFLR